MGTRQDLDDAREVFLRELDVDPQTANRIADVIERVYIERALGQPRDIVLAAASWAARQLRRLPIRALRQVDEERIRTALNHSDCPLCIGDGGGGKGGSGSPVTKVPPRKLVYQPDVLQR